MNARRAWHRAVGLLIVSLLLFLPLTGCWDEVDLQDVSYISAVGIDYVDGQYILYAQIINFSAVAKTQTPHNEPQKVWMGQGRGESMFKAYYNLGKGAYTLQNLEHLKVIVVHERALSKLSEVLDGLNRQRASRYTAKVYGTQEAMDDVFNADTFFDSSPLNSIMYLPGPHEKQYTYVSSTSMQSAVQMLNERAYTTLIPVLQVTDQYWKYGRDEMNTQLISGVFAFEGLQYQGYVAEPQSGGLRWLSPNYSKVMFEVQSGNRKATLSIPKAEYKLHWEKGNANSPFRLELSLRGHVVEMDGMLDKQELIASLEAKVREEIERTYKEGLSRGMDLFNLEHHLYRYHNRYWQGHVRNRNWRPKDDELQVDVKFRLNNSGLFDLQGDT
ncbi:Ger(x)C family spore germination protein [Paenibacillus sp. J5C_2022]|uniref:Ger(x)C family spore germination protein n=1 Tax=Paenibacillus sp. J5C2022 TaxID=2977129 RepID=UPI0021CFFCE2|nr:Ger(x)C family spore germination protein [Paenibacillus sp. J5C2022]MCU6710321.1 Ger(x)C family spore germination protein [Paenibacillus sp. J5C2022]